MVTVTSRARLARGRGLAALAAVTMAAGLAAIPAVASASVGQPSPPSRATSAARHASPQLTALAALEQRARASLHGQVAHSSVITGTVLGAYGLPVAGACVTAVGRSGSVTTSATPSGAFTIAGLRAGSYTLEYRDCAAPGLYRAIWSGGAGWQRTAARVQLGVGQVRHVPAMMLPATPPALQSRAATWHRFRANAVGRGLSPAAAAKAGQISGVVTGHGKGLRGVCVVVFPVNGGQGYGATTDKHGSYVVQHVPAGRYDVTFATWLCQKGNWLQQVYKGHNTPFGFLGGDAVTVRSGKTTKGIDAHLRLGGEISGTVTTRSGRKLGGICVNAEGTVLGGGVGIGLQTSGDGSYQLHALFPGKYRVDFTTGCGNNANYAPAALKAIKITYGKLVSAGTTVMVPGGVITGIVRLGSSSGTPLAGICVAATNSDGSSFASAATNAAGRYRLTSLGTQTYQVQFSPGCNNNGNYVGPIKYAHATAGKITGGVNAVMVLGAKISGTVTDIHGKPLSGMCINVNGPSSGLSPYGTLRNGSYSVNRLPAGTYELGFSTGCGNSGDYAPYWYNNQDDISLATPIKLTRGASLTINAQMQPGAVISGTVTDSHGRKLSGICVAASGATADVFGGAGQVTFSRHGSYQISGLTPGQYQVDFGCGGSKSYADQWFPNAPSPQAAEQISVPAGHTTGVSAVLRPGGTITGVVRTQSGKPLASVCISADNIKDRFATNVIAILGPGPATNSRGVYRFNGLAAGRYIVQFNQCSPQPRYAAQWYRNQASQRSATPVTVKSGVTTARIDATMRLGGTIAGRVADSAGKPLNNTCVFASNASTGQFGFATTGKTGTYAVHGVATGSYTVSFSPCNSPVNLVTVTRHIKVTAPHTTSGVNARLVPGGSASGVVTAVGSDGPVAFTCVEFISANPANPGGFGFTGANGSYLATGIAPGSYQVLFNDPLCGPAGLAPQWYNGQPTKATATNVTITVGHTTTGINAALQTDGAITGTVHGPLSKPLSGICVTAMPLVAGFAPVVAVSGKSGGFTLIDMSPGRYKVEFSSGCGANGYKTQWWKNAASRQQATAFQVSAAQTVTGIDATLRH